MFDDLQRAIPNPPWRGRHRQAWISPETWSLIGTNIEALGQRDQQSSWALARAIKTELQGDRRRQATKSESAV